MPPVRLCAVKYMTAILSTARHEVKQQQTQDLQFNWLIAMLKEVLALRLHEFLVVTLFLYKEKKEEIWLSPMTKAPTPTEMSKGQSDNTNNATKKFD